MRPSNSPSPSAPQIVHSNPEFSGKILQMPQPFGSGIGFKPQVVNPSLVQSPPTGYPNVPSQPSYPSYAQTTPPNVYSSNYPQNAPIHPPTTANYHSPQTNSPMDPWVHQNSQNTHSHGQGHPNYNYSHYQTPPNIYPNLNHSVPFSYSQPNPVLHQSTSGYMRQVN